MICLSLHFTSPLHSSLLLFTFSPFLLLSSSPLLLFSFTPLLSVLCRGGIALNLSIDRKASDPEEIARIAESGQYLRHDFIRENAERALINTSDFHKYLIPSCFFHLSIYLPSFFSSSTTFFYNSDSLSLFF